ncbi:WD40 repeat-like protein [Dendrothele bispora CBS 962.96]|uniref:WD40 repeat-like protein n=1 Tax=Dendrothele bispora (strain CBS 962.96) TaxID=1314807 RepID=A0A4S8LSN1_DENBC|nr:WD40 repeat-like protein [Dendrothele bispora CBS 962.96]
MSLQGQSYQAFSSWQNAPQSVFTKLNRTVPYFPGHPKQWGEELAHIDGAGSIAINDNGNLLGVWQRSEEITIRFQPGQDKDGMVLLNGMREPTGRQRSVFKWCNLEDCELNSGPFEEATEDAALLAVDTILKKTSYAREDIDLSTIRKGFHDVLSSTQIQLEMQTANLFEGWGSAFSHDGSYFLYTPADNLNTVVIVDSKTRQERCTLIGHTEEISWSITSPDDSILVTTAYDRTVRIWNATNGEELHVLTFENECWNGCLSGAFSHDGKLVGITAGFSVRVWSVEREEFLHSFEFANHDQSLGLGPIAFNPDGKSLATGSTVRRHPEDF